MFNRNLWILSTIFIVQVIFIGWTIFIEPADGGEETPFINLNRSEIKEVRIKKINQPVLVINYSDGRWVLTDTDNTPVESSQVETLISRILSLKSSWPVAQTQVSIDQFQVGENNALAKIDFILTSKEKLTLLLGRSPSVNSTYARIAGSRDIYQIAFNVLDLSVRPDHWLVKK